MELTFQPGAVKPGSYGFSIGTAGSCTLVLQTVLPPLLTASGTSQIRISGGTHNKASPPVDFLQRAFLRTGEEDLPGRVCNLPLPESRLQKMPLTLLQPPQTS